MKYYDPMPLMLVMFGPLALLTLMWLPTPPAPAKD